ncbi:TonB-dependent receptor [Luteimonas composti]|uniref:TonB-dependent receptor n=1 Tax=Luteimonas composti TaxID=398257 RepID=A0ABT6MQ09_9GAMM|nr:TonB-dependent receptor [Luteimonas composti]MDH7452719.1 TonB-dependent receptor [Luteimonas composti]
MASALALAIALALSGTAAAQDGATSADSASTRTLDRINVTGSRIKRTDVEAALPVTVIQKEEIQAQGISSAEQLLQYMNIAGNGSDNLAANAGIAPADLRGNNGVSGANLRGQGADATLVLLNGRRVATHGLRGTAVDLNSIPFAAIDRVEVLRDGASAVYGTDAIGGVINFITRTDYQGAQASAFVDVTEEGGGNIYRTDFLVGGGDLDTDRWNAFLSLGARKNDVLRGNARDFSNSFQPERGLSPDTRGTPFATVFNLEGGITGTGLIDPDGASVNGVNILNLPGGAGCEAGGDDMGPYDYRLWATTAANVASRYGCAWDYPAAAVMQQPLETVQAIARATFRISDGHQAYFEFMGSNAKANRIFEPNQISSSATTTAVFNPSTWYPLNDRTRETYDMVYNGLAAFFGEDALTYGAPIAYRWRCMECGPREIQTTTKAFRFMAGVDGMIGDWDYSIGLAHASSESESELGTGYHYVEGLQAAFAGGLLNPFLLPGQAQSPEAIAALEAASARGVVLYGGKSTVTNFDAVMSGSIGQLPGGDLQVAVGVDLRREAFEFNGDRRAAATRPAIFNAPFDDANALPEATRDVKAIFTEINLPFFERFEATLAGRYDHYTGFGGTANPKVSFKWQPLDSLAVRGAYSTGFKVPEFSKLFSGLTESQNNALDLADPATCPGGVVDVNRPGCEQIDPDILTGGNPNLAPEESRQKSLGIVLAPVDWFNMSLDWWEIERINTIRTGPDLDILREYYDLYADNWIRDASGEVVLVDRRFVNSGGTLMSGVEIDLNFRGQLAGGDWNLNLNGSYLDNYQDKLFEFMPYSENRVGEYIRYWSLPLRWKHTLGFSWARGDWAHSITQIYRDGYKDEEPTSVSTGHYIPSQWNPDVDRYITYNYSTTYTGFEGLRLTFGVKNLLDEDPPFTAHKNDWASGAGWEPRIADPRGRAYTFLVQYDFW